MPAPSELELELVYLAACTLAMGGLAVHAMGNRIGTHLGMACAAMGFAIAVAGTLLAGWEGMMLVGSASALAATVAAATAWKGRGGRQGRG